MPTASYPDVPLHSPFQSLVILIPVVPFLPAGNPHPHRYIYIPNFKDSKLIQKHNP